MCLWISVSLNLIKFLLQAFPNLHNFKIYICQIASQANFVFIFYLMKVVFLVFNNLIQTGIDVFCNNYEL